MKYPRYPAYKDSGVEWIGEIPRHWNVQKLKRSFQVLNGSTPRSDNPLYWDGNIIWVTPEDLSLTVSPFISKSSRQITSEGYDSCGTNLVPKGSIIVSTRAPIGYVKIARVELCTNQGCRSLVKKTNSNEKYFFYYLSCFASVLNSFGQGSTFVELSSENLKMFQATVPPIGEQISLTKFLDSETSKIDSLISKTQKMIELLREKRQAIITHAVTKGLDPNVPMKDSGIEWIGEIPRHWNVKRLKFVSRIQFSNVDKHSFNSEMPVLLANYIDVYKNQFITNEMEFMKASASLNELKKFHLKAGDVLVTKDSETPDDIAIPALVKSTLPNLICGYHLAMLRPNGHFLDSNYLFYLYSDKKFRGKYESEANGITRFGLSQASFKDTFICMPDISEQRAISLFLEEQISKIQYLISKTQKMIELLNEYKTSLITQAVTGKIDVRDSATQNSPKDIQP